jgi:hypothetical protein
MAPTFKNKTLIADLYSMNPPASRRVLLFYHPIDTTTIETGLISDGAMEEGFGSAIGESDCTYT